MFKGEDAWKPFKKEIFVFGLSDKNHHHILYKAGFDTTDEQILRKQNLLWSISDADHF